MDWLESLNFPADVWFDTKMFVERSVGFSNDVLHVLIGAILHLLFAGVLKCGVRSWKPWLLVLAIELVNEWVDLNHETWPDAAMQWGEGAKDIALTLSVPTLLLIVARRWPRVLR